MEFLIIAILRAFLLPPGVIIVGVVGGLLIAIKHPPLGRAVVFITAFVGVLFTLPIVAGGLAAWAVDFPPSPPEQVPGLKAEAIVILAGGKDSNRDEYGGATISKATLQRIRYGAKLARQLGLPILVSGGVVLGSGIGEARYMADTLADEFGLKPRWVEDKSRNTAQNARFSAALLGAKKIILVTHALHMRRAVDVFSRQGMQVIPAPVASAAHAKPLRVSLFSFLPSEKALLVSRDALYEILGILWYALRY